MSQHGETPHAATRPTRSPRELLGETERAQASASDPLSSAWVSANAGAGKTHVLKRRVLRILLAGTPPNRILCLTYTKAAAAEMASRVFADLSSWATASADKLEIELGKVLARDPTEHERNDARKLFARAIETPGGLKVQTIHAFCERLLQRFPLEAGVPPGFAILDDTEGFKLRRQAIDRILIEATRDRGGNLGSALDTVIAFASGDGFDESLAGVLAKRDWLTTLVRLEIGDAAGIDAAAGLYKRALGVREDATRASIEAELAGVLSPAALERALMALAAGGKSDATLAATLRAAVAARTDAARIAALEEAFMTKQLEARSDTRFVTKAVREADPDVHLSLSRAKDRFVDLHLERQGLRVADASAALMRIADAVMQGYSRAKSRRAALDFDDLVIRTANLLSGSSAAEWVLYKLDGGLDHILVDEAQDTSPVQWSVIENLAREFFAGAGAHDQPRSVFAVGDEKQSIYSFQGAQPRLFALTGARFEKTAAAAGLPWRRQPLTLSFRTVAPLLDAVDRVFEDAARTPGLRAGPDAIRHVALRLGHAGKLEIWDTETPVEQSEADVWDPLAETTQPSPVTRLANRIADTIKRWIDGGEMLASEARPVRAGDVLILLRRRHPFAAPMVAALKARDIPVAGADRLALTEQIAVQDLVALGDFLTMPEDELALATVLKSPLFDLDDDDLLALAPARKGTLWTALLAAGAEVPRYAAAADTLKRWRSSADQSPPFEFYAEVLDRDGGRRRLIERLGPEAIDTITEFLNLAIVFDETEPPSLSGFLDWLRGGAREIKRDMEHGRDEVRVLTVHGAKGLEAPIVFLPDTCAGRSGRRPGDLVELDASDLDESNPDAGAPRPLAWPVKGASRLPQIQAGRAKSDQAETEERNRLLYVAMTRARDRLYVAGFETLAGRTKNCWYDLIEAGLAGQLSDGHDDTGAPVRRIEVTQSVAPGASRAPTDLAEVAQPPPDWSQRMAPRETQLAVPLAPSQLAPYDVDEIGDPADPVGDVAAGTTTGHPPSAAPPDIRIQDAAREPATPSPLMLAGDHRFLRGTLTHALLEHLPTLPISGRARAAAAFVATRGAALTARVRASIVAETMAVLEAPSFAAVFGPDSRAEVPIVAELAPPAVLAADKLAAGKPGAKPVRLNGVIDRLVVTDHEVMIIDYKTNRPPPSDVAGVARAYLFQLAAYSLALSIIYPGRSVRAALLWTDGPRLMEIPSHLLERHQAELWRLVPSQLDG